MKKTVYRLSILVAGLLVIIVVLVIGLGLAGSSRLAKTIQVPVMAVPVSSDPAALARGRMWTTAICTSCHGSDLSGAVLIDEAGMATVFAANVTGLGATHSDEDLVRAIRHGVAHDGRKLIAMPADVFIHFSAEDLGAIIAYLKTLPLVENEIPAPHFGLPGRVLLAAGLFGEPFPAEHLDHTSPFPEMPPVGANLAYGKYLGGFCTACHGEDLGGAQPTFDPTFPYAPNLTSGGEPGRWTQADFLQTMRSGLTPDGRLIAPEYMPWREFSQLTDPELIGLWLYLESLPAVASRDQ
jgi:hypothetical protein